MVTFRTTDVPRSRAGVYLRRAESLLKAAHWGLDTGDSSVGAVNAVQAGISAADAFLVSQTGQRPSGTDHHEAIGLIARTSSNRREEIGHQLSRLLDKKAEVEYDDAEITLEMARKLVVSADRLVSAVRSELG
jgi:HEPN domain-containing protein